MIMDHVSSGVEDPENLLLTGQKGALTHLPQHLEHFMASVNSFGSNFEPVL